MAMMERTASVVWQGNLTAGNGTVTVHSGAFPPVPVTWEARTERAGNKTSPEELLAAAHASCFSMAMSNNLAKAGHAPERLEVTAVCTLDRTDAGPRVTKMALSVRGMVSGLDATAFQEAAEAAKVGCPISNALDKGIEVTLDASLAS